MQSYCLLVAIFCSAISGVIVAFWGVFAVFEAPLIGLAAIFLGAPVCFAETIVFSYVLNRLESEKKKVEPKRDSDAKDVWAPGQARPTSDTAGTPWAENPGATEDR